MAAVGATSAKLAGRTVCSVHQTHLQYGKGERSLIGFPKATTDPLISLLGIGVSKTLRPVGFKLLTLAQIIFPSNCPSKNVTPLGPQGVNLLVSRHR